MDHDRYGLDGQPIYPRPGHFDHVTGQQLPTFRGEGQAGRSPLTGFSALLGHRYTVAAKPTFQQ